MVISRDGPMGAPRNSTRLGVAGRHSRLQAVRRVSQPQEVDERRAFLMEKNIWRLAPTRRSEACSSATSTYRRFSAARLEETCLVRRALDRTSFAVTADLPPRRFCT